MRSQYRIQIGGGGGGARHPSGQISLNSKEFSEKPLLREIPHSPMEVYFN